MWLKTSAARFGPSVTSSTAALRRPDRWSLDSAGTRAVGAPGRASAAAAGSGISGLPHPGAELRCDANGLEPRGPVDAAVAPPVAPLLRPALLHLGERRRRVQL